jgi:hypothetical protein
MERILSSAGAGRGRTAAGPSRATCPAPRRRAARVVVAAERGERDAGGGAGAGGGGAGAGSTGQSVGVERRSRVMTRVASGGEAEAFLSPTTLLEDVEKMFEKGQPRLIPSSIDDAQSLPELFAAIASGGQADQVCPRPHLPLAAVAPSAHATVRVVLRLMREVRLVPSSSSSATPQAPRHLWSPTSTGFPRTLHPTEPVRLV